MRPDPPFGTWLALFCLLTLLIVTASEPLHHPAVTVPGTPSIGRTTP